MITLFSARSDFIKKVLIILLTPNLVKTHFIFLKMLHAKRQAGLFSHLWLILESQRRLIYFSNKHVKRILVFNQLNAQNFVL